MRWALNQITVAGGSRRPPADVGRDLGALRAGGWRAVELWLPHWDDFVGANGLPAARRLLDDSGLTAAGACGGAPFFFAPDGDALRRALDVLEGRLEQCQALGAAHLVVAPGFTEPAEPSGAAFERAVENTGAAADLAARYGTRLGIEFLAAARLIKTLPAALRLAEATGRPNAGVVVDTYHLYAGLSKTEDLDLFRAAPERLFFVHVSDVSAAGLRDLWTVPDRVLPGAGGIPNVALLERVRALGYDGTVSLELFDAGFESRWQEAPAGAAREAYARCTALLPDEG